MLTSFALSFSKQPITAFVNIPGTMRHVLNNYRIETYINRHCTLSEKTLLTISVIRACSSRYHDFTRPESAAKLVTNLLPKSLLICYDSSRIKMPVTEFPKCDCDAMRALAVALLSGFA